jgi:hypothetical protein
MGFFLIDVKYRIDRGETKIGTALLDNISRATYISDKFYTELTGSDVYNVLKGGKKAIFPNDQHAEIFGPVNVSFKFESGDETTSSPGFKLPTYIFPRLRKEICFPQSICEKFKMYECAERHALTKEEISMLAFAKKSVEEKNKDTGRYMDRTATNLAAASREEKARKKERLLNRAAELERCAERLRLEVYRLKLNLQPEDAASCEQKAIEYEKAVNEYRE